MWIVDSGTDRIYQYNSAAGLTAGSKSASTSFALAAGNTNPQGIADPPAPSSTTFATPASAAEGMHSPITIGVSVRANRDHVRRHETAMVPTQRFRQGETDVVTKRTRFAGQLDDDSNVQMSFRNQGTKASADDSLRLVDMLLTEERFSEILGNCP